ncbi:O-acetyl-ADP-ribose deacetylase (regulator of RNase III) [Salana multivorans]|uniref:O-acetyl-ADP-ribose deacetylase (Regulator of RNase III) n=1 Tax=Salana multivorans TaxID=120377 RepID=A0A3N2D8Y5_9MICO|nr:macro domain-containing protein [Salana multivorans]ROR96247.1 O-acetyl-ADP-ribose deacetylase (regulator of RNase III) [Salana multivorans]
MTRLTAVLGDLTHQRVDVVVNAASNRMRGGGGVDGAIHRAGGPAILRDCIARFPDGIATGDAGWTTAGNLPARWVVHTVGPNYAAGQRDPSLLRSCYRRSLAVADSLGATTVAFPLISSGIFAWPLADAIEIAVDTIAATPATVDHVMIVTIDDATHRRVHAQILRRCPPSTEAGSVGALLDDPPTP